MTDVRVNTPRQRPAERSVPAAEAYPLDGAHVAGDVSTVAGRTALRHLIQLGATPDPQIRDDSPCTTERLRLRPNLTGPEVADASGVPPVDATIAWGPDEAGDLVDEVTVQAACGLMTVHGLAEGPAHRIAVDYASVAAGVLAGQGVLAAALGALRGRPVAAVHTTVAQAALLAVGQYLAAATAEDADDAPPLPAGRRPPFVSLDGVVFELETLDAGPWGRFWTALGAPDDAVRRGWRPFMLRYATAMSPLPPALHDTARQVPYRVIEEAAAGAGVSLCPVRRIGDRLVEVDPYRRPWEIRALAAAVPVDRGTARTGADGDGPLAGLRVVEATRRVQGPLAAHLLRLLGAQVLRIEPPGGDPLRGMPPMAGDCSARFRALNDGKEVHEIDIKDPAGRARIRELVGDADVFLHNWAPGRAERLGLDAASLARVNPGLVYAYASAWGDTLGPNPPLGTDFMVQAYSGLGDQVYGDGGAPRPSLMTLLDVLGGLVAAEGVIAGLLARHRTGFGHTVDTSLLGAADLLQHMSLRDASPRHGDRSWSAWEGPLTTADGRLAVHLPDPASAVTLARVLDAGPAPDTAAIRSRCAGLTTDDLRRALAEAGVTATPLTDDLSALADDPRFTAVLRRDRACYVTAPWRFS